MVVVAPLALQAGAHVAPVQPLQLHRVPALAGADLLPTRVQDLSITRPGHGGARPTWYT